MHTFAVWVNRIVTLEALNGSCSEAGYHHVDECLEGTHKSQHTMEARSAEQTTAMQVVQASCMYFIEHQMRSIREEHHNAFSLQWQRPCNWS